MEPSLFEQSTGNAARFETGFLSALTSSDTVCPASGSREGTARRFYCDSLLPHVLSRRNVIRQKTLINSTPAHREFDAIVIGSGMGGLACASIMAKLRRWRVLVLERHFKIGGFTHTFTRPGGWSWDVGLHYVGEMGDGMLGRRLFDLITDGAVKWNPLPDVYDNFVYPTLQIGARKGEENFRSNLTDAFPNECANIEQYFRDLRRATSWAN